MPDEKPSKKVPLVVTAVVVAGTVAFSLTDSGEAITRHDAGPDTGAHVSDAGPPTFDPTDPATEAP